MSKFTYDIAAEHIRRKHPGCPDFVVHYFATEIATRSWQRASLGKAVGITMQNYLRHYMTDYDGLLLSGLGRKEARARVQPLVHAMLAIWKREPTLHTDRLGDDAHGRAGISNDPE
ncbi:hypothetical protein GGQ64_004583 [Rhizobium azooxidifex]|uniref:DUF2293 domain-containing protein n=1 Tax=Mycoplana azooxidifex TaxID=1636188 RepID=A0A7W6D9S8_9HYPH|nr:DUF2293 domain-containing protein [Mycoplana azooxidifex]MBB3979343.1 hypothetical protein [Mycoplana azooxidifex]